MTTPVSGLAASNEVDVIDVIDAASQASLPAPAKADPAAFDELVSKAAGNLVKRLPTGRAAKAWEAWRPPTNALGLQARRATVKYDPNREGTNTLSATGPGNTGAVFANATTHGEAVVNLAANHLGVPYLWGGADPEKGFDCSGLIQHAYRDLGVEMPKWSRDQAEMGVEVDSIDAALPGDILAFGDPVNHVALYVGDGQMLHAPKTGEVVKIEEIDRPIASIRRILTPGDSGELGQLGSVSPTEVPDLAAPMVDASPALNTGPVDGVPFAGLFSEAGARWNVDPGLLAAVAKTESAFDTTAVSTAGAQGLMQFMPATAREMNVDPWDPVSAIDGAARYLRTSLDQFDNVEHAIASYNAGRGAVARHGGIPPFQETQNYVNKVLETWRNAS